MRFAAAQVGTFSVKLIALALCVTAVLIASLGWHMWRSYQDFNDAQATSLRAQELSGVITYIDEVLTMSARMATATGDLAWEQRYREFEPRLLDAIREAERLAPSSFASEAAARTDAANANLVAMEDEAFDLVAAGDQEAAAAILLSTEYDEQKAAYAAANAIVSAAIKESATDAQDSAERALIVASLTVGAPVLVAVWVPTLMALYRHARGRREAELALAAALEDERARARTDPLTGVLNHGAIVEELKVMVTTGPPREAFSVAMVDVDGLKSINDTFGHPAGDAVLVAVARALSAGGAKVGRYGGDEFIVLLPGADRTAAERYRDQARGRLLREVALAAGSPEALGKAAVSFGFAIFPDDTTNPSQLITMSDRAMYASREARRAGALSPGQAQAA